MKKEKRRNLYTRNNALENIHNKVKPSRGVYLDEYLICSKYLRPCVLLKACRMSCASELSLYNDTVNPRPLCEVE